MHVRMYVCMYVCMFTCCGNVCPPTTACLHGPSPLCLHSSHTHVLTQRHSTVVVDSEGMDGYVLDSEDASTSSTDPATPQPSLFVGHSWTTEAVLAWLKSIGMQIYSGMCVIDTSRMFSVSMFLDMTARNIFTRCATESFQANRITCKELALMTHNKVRVH